MYNILKENVVDLLAYIIDEAKEQVNITFIPLQRFMIESRFVSYLVDCSSDKQLNFWHEGMLVLRVCRNNDHLQLPNLLEVMLNDVVGRN